MARTAAVANAVAAEVTGRGTRPQGQLTKPLSVHAPDRLTGTSPGEPANMLACQYSGSPPSITSPPRRRIRSPRKSSK